MNHISSSARTSTVHPHLSEPLGAVVCVCMLDNGSVKWCLDNLQTTFYLMHSEMSMNTINESWIIEDPDDQGTLY